MRTPVLLDEPQAEPAPDAEDSELPAFLEEEETGDKDGDAYAAAA